MEQHVGDGYCIGDLSLDLEARTLRRGDVLIELPPLSFGLLALLAERAPAVVSHDEIAELVWPGRVVSPETLTQRVKLLRSALSDDARSPRYVGLVRGEGYRLLCDAHRVSSGAKISGPKPSSRLRPRLLLFAALMVILVAGATLAYLPSLLKPGSQDAAGQHGALAQDKSVAVLPFDDMTAEGDHAYLADGIADELLHRLSQSNDLRVIARTSSFALRDSGLDIPEIAARLGVRYVLQGSLRESDGALRITAQLVDARENTPVWSHNYDHLASNLFEIQDLVAGEVVARLATALALPKTERLNPTAYSLYLQARHLANRDNTLEDQRALLERALELEPGYLEAKLSLAWTYRREALAAESQGDSETADQQYLQYRSLLDEVLSNNPDNAGANAFLAWERLGAADLAAATAFAERALASEPTHFAALTTAGEIMVRLWREEEGIEILRYVAERDPLSPHHYDNIAEAYLNAGAAERAEEAFRTILTLFPDYGGRAPWGIGLALLLQGKPSEAIPEFENMPEGHPLRSHGIALALHDLGRHDDAQAALDGLLDVDRGTPNIEWFIATAYAWFGDIDAAFEFLGQQRQEAYPFFFFMGNSPLYENLRDDPRWLPFLESIKLDPASLRSVDFDPTLPPGIGL